MLPWSVAALALVAAAGSAWSALLPAPVAPAVVTRTQRSQKDFSLLLAISNDGTKVAYATAGGPSTTYLSLRMMDQFDAKAIPGSENGAWPIFSPDGQWIAYSALTGSNMRKIPLTGGTSVGLG